MGACIFETGDYIVLGPKMMYVNTPWKHVQCFNEIIFDECKIKKNWNVKKIYFYFSLMEITNKPFEEIK